MPAHQCTVTVPGGQPVSVVLQEALPNVDDVDVAVADLPDVCVFTVRAPSPERLRDAVSALKYAVINRGKPWRDPFARTPQRPDRARVTPVVGAFPQPALAWAALAPANPRWTFIEELFATCESCGGSALDPYAGACYACTHNGKVIAGYRTTPHPPTLEHVIAFAADLAAMNVVDAAVTTLLARLAPWGVAASDGIEWLLEAPSHPGGSAPDVIPRCMAPVFHALRAALGDETIPEGGLSAGWFSQGRRAWQDASHLEPFVGRSDPFEPLGAILGAGYRIALSETSAMRPRLSVDA